MKKFFSNDARTDLVCAFGVYGLASIAIMLGAIFFAPFVLLVLPLAMLGLYVYAKETNNSDSPSMGC